jgi:hypothetical protein
MHRNRNKENKVREIAKRPDTPNLTDGLIEALTDLCFYQSPMTDCDLLFVFGSNILHAAIANQITYFLNECTIPTVIISGGIANYEASSFEPLAESQLIFSHIEKINFPTTDFIIENKSKNTLENVAFSRVHFDFSTVRHICFLSHSYASMRSYLTLQKYFKLSKVGNCHIKIPSEISGISIAIDNWYMTAHGRKLVWGEYLRFKTYGIRGDFPISDVLDKMNRVEQHVQGHH